MKGKLINNYKKWMETGEIPEWGLCFSLKDTDYYQSLKLFKPTTEDFKELRKNKHTTSFWGSEMEASIFNYWQIYYGFTPLRQTIVLFICAMHDEL